MVCRKDKHAIWEEQMHRKLKSRHKKCLILVFLDMKEIYDFHRSNLKLAKTRASFVSKNTQIQKLRAAMVEVSKLSEDAIGQTTGI